MAGLVLHVNAGINKNAHKVLIVAEIVGVKVDLVPDFEMGVSNKTPEFLKLNPLGKVPVLETPDGPISESNAIARYVANLKGKLTGSTLYQTALVDQWIDFATTEVDTSLGRWLYPRFGYLPYAPEVEEHAIEAIKRAFGALNSYLASRTYLVGHFVTLADVITICNLTWGFRSGVFSEEFMAPFPHVERYFWTVSAQPAFKKILGEIVRGSVEVPPPPAKGQAPRGSQTPRPSKAKAEAPKPKPKEEAPPKPKEEAPAADEEEAPKPKAKNPLDLLPPSPMVLDDWKRLYSNTKAKDFAEVALKGFWEMYDPEGYSLWFCDYKYNDENTVPFVTMNKVSGFLQRMDFIRKYAFAKICILGDQPPFKIKGVWLFRGPEIPQQVRDECYDLELYEWTKADPTDHVHKERINAYFEEPDVIEGEKLLEAKCFK
ncbi:hypothetical protein SELMODRAFT_156635 [Selaginella moellendorffii]|uniref:Uncharacterized protein n=1 Tax=Selaginella moellendorffii TaxID=88036 RepID=D8SMA1_SELML|nr:elongation factor 1-gamma 2 [Selaginella moellendorffii]EFJ14564.1 hypothetical protein SELMODRAFT_156635 [Selaginella moellendorffii]|eukprot:XP_002984514.1 elongation factor 1-gamma 2 [Selaginella moellendorffii]